MHCCLKFGKRTLAIHDAKIAELGLKVQFWTDYAEKLLRLQAQVAVRDVELIAMCLQVLQLIESLEEVTLNQAVLRSKMDSLHAAG